jgi:hypothetical protein
MTASTPSGPIFLAAFTLPATQALGFSRLSPTVCSAVPEGEWLHSWPG